MNEEQTNARSAEQNRSLVPAAESPVLIHIWEVLDQDRESVALRNLDGMLGEVAAQPGFVSARLFESADRHSIASVVEMRTVEDRQRLEQLPAVRDTLRQLDGLMNVVGKLYRELEAYRSISRHDGDERRR